LIDAAGMRGQGNDGARVSDKHANFIQAAPGGRAADIIEVMTLVQRAVSERHGVTLRSEVCLVGFDSEVTERFADPRHGSPERVEARSRLAGLMGETK
jgi:UDP-N-acetylmuramate dehydrogenase